MNLLDPSLDPPEHRIDVPWDIIRAAYCQLDVDDLDAARRFYVDALGFVPTAETDGALYLRGYEEAVHHSLVLVRAAEPALHRLGFRVRRESDLDLLAAHFEGLGRPIRWLAPGESFAVGRALLVEDPLGFPAEFFQAMEPAPRLLQRFDLHRGAQVMRIDHFNIHVPDVEQAHAYYRELGFYTTELIADDEPDGRVYAVWLTRKPLVHDVALTAGSGPRLHHVAFTVADGAAVLRVCDQLGAAHLEEHIERGPGRHGVSNAFYVYLRDPSGHRLEFYVGDYYTGDPDVRPLRWSVHDDRRRSFWGHAVVPSWYDESSRVRRIDGSLAPVVEVESAERLVTASLVD